MMSVDLRKIGTESRNANTYDIDRVSTIEILKKINNEDNKIATAVSLALSQIERVVDATYSLLNKGGRLIYTGAGTSGRIGIIDAVECRPTYSVSDSMVMCLMAGGEKAFIKAVEGAEDSVDFGVNDLKNINLTSLDIVIGIAASGRTPYVIAGIEYAKSIGATTACLVTTSNSKLANLVTYPIEVITGAEVVTGSTRMKAGTAQKMVCNMISTAVMIKLGKVYENLMVDVMATNEKLIARAQNIIIDATGVSLEVAIDKLAKYKTVKKALFSILSGIDDINEIDKLLNRVNGHIKKALDSVK